VSIKLPATGQEIGHLVLLFRQWREKYAEYHSCYHWLQSFLRHCWIFSDLSS